MLNEYFYHERIRKSVAMFGSLFNNIYILHKNSAGAVINTKKVPLSYAPKSKFLERIREHADLDESNKVALKLPRMSFEILAYTYAPERQLSKIGQFNRVGLTDSDRAKFYAPVPYNLSMQLNIFCKVQDDALQIVEQILPFFNPQYTLTIKPFSAYADIIEDCPITLSGMSYSDDYEGAMDARRTIVYQLDFEMEANFYSGIANTQIIRKIETEQYLMDIPNGLTADSDAKVSTLTVLPNPLNVTADSDFGFTTTLIQHVDSSQ
jgi:hypothetical protein|tara:strand:- start:4937 stop:5731 length:795 start_codon:yes stop_codon:yes gene_type:complete